MLNRLILLFVLNFNGLYSIFYAVDAHDCIINGETDVQFLGRLTLSIECAQPFTVLSVGIEDSLENKTILIGKNPDHIERITPLNRYLLKFENNTLYLMDLDDNLKDSCIIFEIYTDKEVKQFVSKKINFISTHNEIVTKEERILNMRFLTDIYVFQPNREMIIDLNIYEKKYKIKILNIYVCSDLLKDCGEIFPSFGINKKEIAHGTNVNLFNKKIFITKFTKEIQHISINLRFIQEKRTKVICTRKFDILGPIYIDKISRNFIYWKKTQLLTSFFSINYISKNISIKFPIGFCFNDYQKFKCNRQNGLKLIIGNMNSSGIEIVSNHIMSFDFEIKFDHMAHGHFQSFTKNIHINLNEEVNEIKYTNFKKKEFENTDLVMNSNMLENTGILNMSLINRPSYTVNFARPSSFYIRSGNNNYIICKNYGDFKKEFLSIYSPYLMSCNEFEILFYDINEDHFDNIIIGLRMKISTDSIIHIGAIPLKIDFLRLQKSSPKIFKKYNRNMISENYIIIGRQSKIDIIMDREMYLMTELKYCNDHNKCYDIPLKDERAIIKIKGLNIILDRDTLLFHVFVVAYKKLLFICSITEGINILSNTIGMIIVDHEIFIPIRCTNHSISWSLKLQNIKFTLILFVDGYIYSIGQCDIFQNCLLNDNLYIKSLSYYEANFSMHNLLKIFTLFFEFTIITNDHRLFNVKNSKQYDLTSDECSQSLFTGLIMAPKKNYSSIIKKSHFMIIGRKNRLNRRIKILISCFLTITTFIILSFVINFFWKRRLLKPNFNIFFYKEEMNQDKK